MLTALFLRFVDGRLTTFLPTRRSSQDKTLLLFVIRDHIGATPLANLRATLTADLNRLWDGLSKPEGLESSRIDDFFDLDFVTLPHKLLQPELFEEQVADLRKRFSTGAGSGAGAGAGGSSVFQSKYHKRIPADGISTYMGTIWDAVVSNKDLDLPTQQELLAQFRCGELAAAAFATFSALVAAFPPALPAGQVDSSLGARMAEAKQAALAAYDAAASRYHPAVYARQRAELVTKVHGALLPLFATQLKSLHKGVLRAFRVEVEDALRGDGYDFARVVRDARTRAEGTFEEEAARVVLEESGWSAEEERVALGEDMDSVAELLRKEETRKMVAVIEVRRCGPRPGCSRVARSRDLLSCAPSLTRLSPAPHAAQHQASDGRDGRARARLAERRHVGQGAQRVQGGARQSRGGLRPQGDE